MDSTNFCYWLKGFFEISRADSLTPDQIQEIKNHLNLVFTKITPDLPPFTTYPSTYCSSIGDKIFGSDPSKAFNFITC